MFNKEILSKITETISIIRLEYPELYDHLDETPIRINSDVLSHKDFSRYLETLKDILKNYSESKHTDIRL